MRRGIRMAMLALALLSPEGLARAESWLQGRVLENHGGTKRPAAGAQVWIVNVGNPYTTRSDGGYRVLVPDSIRVGQNITLHVKRKGWFIDTPEGGDLRYAQDSTVNIVLSPEASTEFLSPTHLAKLLESLPERVKSQIKPDGKPGDTDPVQIIRDYAAEHHLPEKDVIEKVDALVRQYEQSGDTSKHCLVEIYRKNLSQATTACRTAATSKTDLLKQKRQEVENLSKSLQQSEGPVERLLVFSPGGETRVLLGSRQRFSRTDAHSATINTDGRTQVRFVADSRPSQQGSAKLEEAKRQLIKLTEEVVGEFKATGDTYYANYQFEKALEAYKEGLGYVEKQDLPTLWATMQWISGMANSEIGVRTGSELLQQYLKEAVNAYREAQTVYTKREFPKAWAALENNLGNVLQNQGTRTGGEKGTKLLAEAVSAYRAALTVYTKEALPQDWAMTQSNLAEALFLSGQFEKAKDQLTIMLQYSDLDSEARVALLAIEVANFVALGLPKEVQHSFGTLQQALGEQVPDFSLTWSFSAIKPFIGQNQAFATHRSWLLVFIEHLEGTQRDEMLAAVNGARTESLKTPKP